METFFKLSITFIFLFYSLIGESREDYLFEKPIDYKQKWTRLYSTERESIKKLLSILKKSLTGRRIISLAQRKAAKNGRRLLDLIEGGRVSLTDTTLVRKFSPSSPEKIFLSTRSKIFLDRSLKVVDILLDLSHELTHYALRNQFNPYKKSFHLKKFVKEMIEGRGGEVEAYLIECRVYKELFPKLFNRGSSCRQIYNNERGYFSRKKSILKFYQVGKYMDEFRDELNSFELGVSDFPQISSRPSFFISSSYGLPYPLAAIREYSSILKRVCRNDLKRLQLLEKKFRANVRINKFNENKKYLSIKKLIRSRCQKKL
ncbi:MAG: hypothetical protein CME68_11685 [Halobacteriovoraceae bacterium]|nr:hypothetical protein [Halobacteriovoraceae bacterium]